jgi:hypothetical protein
MNGFCLDGLIILEKLRYSKRLGASSQDGRDAHPQQTVCQCFRCRLDRVGFSSQPGVSVDPVFEPQADYSPCLGHWPVVQQEQFWIY